MSDERDTFYLKEIETTDEMFKNSGITIESFGKDGVTDSKFFPQSDEVVLCGECNRNMYPDKGILVFRTLEYVALNYPIDVYHEDCLGSFTLNSEIIRI